MNRIKKKKNDHEKSSTLDQVELAKLKKEIIAEIKV